MAGAQHVLALVMLALVVCSSAQTTVTRISSDILALDENRFSFCLQSLLVPADVSDFGASIRIQFTETVNGPVELQIPCLDGLYQRVIFPEVSGRQLTVHLHDEQANNYMWDMSVFVSSSVVNGIVKSKVPVESVTLKLRAESLVRVSWGVHSYICGTLPSDPELSPKPISGNREEQNTSGTSENTYSEESTQPELIISSSSFETFVTSADSSVHLFIYIIAVMVVFGACCCCCGRLILVQRFQRYDQVAPQYRKVRMAVIQ